MTKRLAHICELYTSFQARPGELVAVALELLGILCLRGHRASEAKEQGMWLSLQACLELNIIEMFFFLTMQARL